MNTGEKEQLLYALNAMSAQPKAMPSPSVQATPSDNSNADKTAKKKTKREEKKLPKNDVVIELTALAGRGYPAPVNLDNGTGKPAPTIATSR